jgi:Zn-dependent protease with chaperone function
MSDRDAIQDFYILLFGPGLPAGGEARRARFDADTLAVDALPPVDAGTIRVRTGGFNRDQLFLEWPRDGTSFSITPADAAAQAVLLASAPDGLRAALADFRLDAARVGKRSRLGLGLLGLLLALPLLLLGLFFAYSHDIAGWVASRVPVEVEQQIGDAAFAQMRGQLALIEQGAAPEAVRTLGERLTHGSRYRYQWFVVRDPAINAFAMPGGYVVVNSGLIAAADSAEELAGVLAHEVQHVERRHSLNNLIHALGWRAMLALALGDAGGALAGAADTLGQLKFGRDLETEADLLGLQALQRAGIPPQGMESFFRKLMQQEGATPPALLSSHPASEDRFEAIRKAIAQGGPWTTRSIGMDWEAVRRDAVGGER